MQRFALSLALVASLGFGLTGVVFAAEEETSAPKETTTAKTKSCHKSKACHKGKKKVEKTESTTTETAK